MKSISKIVTRIISVIFQLCLGLIAIILVIGSFKVVYLNIKNFHIIKAGDIIESIHTKASESDNLRGTYSNTILSYDKRDTLYGGTQMHLNKRDRVEFRYIGITGNKIFKVNNKTIAAKYDIWDWFSLIIVILVIFLLFKVFNYVLNYRLKT